MPFRLHYQQRGIKSAKNRNLKVTVVAIVAINFAKKDYKTETILLLQSFWPNLHLLLNLSLHLEYNTVTSLHLLLAIIVCILSASQFGHIFMHLMQSRWVGVEAGGSCSQQKHAAEVRSLYGLCLFFLYREHLKKKPKQVDFTVIMFCSSCECFHVFLLTVEMRIVCFYFGTSPWLQAEQSPQWFIQLMNGHCTMPSNHSASQIISRGGLADPATCW